MGYLSAREMGDHTDLDTALGWHLSANHFPPIPSFMVPVAKAAIEAANDGETELEIALPDEVTYQGTTTAPAQALIEYMHLDAFLDFEDFDP